MQWIKSEKNEYLLYAYINYYYIGIKDKKLKIMHTFSFLEQEKNDLQYYQS